MYRFYFGDLELPVTPGKITTKIKGSNKTLSLINENEINILRAPGLTEITFEITLPMLGQYNFSTNYRQPDYYLGAFERLMVEKKPFRLIISRVSPSGKLLYDTNLKVSLENYTITEDAAQGPDVLVAVTLKQYIDYATKIVKVIKPEEQSRAIASIQKKRDSDSAPRAKTYTVKSGDCLWAIAKKFYDEGSMYTKIYDANKDKIKNPNLIYSGQVLVIP